MDKYDALRLKNQLCFPLYACAREVVNKYRPYLAEINLTYTQYVTMMVLWEEERCSAKELGKKLYLDSGTLTPVIKSLEKKGLVRRARSEKDERLLMVEITDEGQALKERAVEIPAKVAGCVQLSGEEGAALYQTLYKILAQT